MCGDPSRHATGIPSLPADNWVDAMHRSEYTVQQILDYLQIYRVDVFSVDIFVLVCTRCLNTDVRSVNAAYHVGKASNSHKFDFL